MTRDALYLFLLASILVSASVNALRCYQCLQLSCESATLCGSIKLSMSQIFFPRRQHLEFNPNRTCPEEPFVNVTAWSPYSQECRKSDSVCLQARLEVLTSFAGLKDSLALERYSEISTKGFLRACASRRFLLGLSDPTLEVKDSEANATLAFLQGLPKDRVTIQEIYYHHFYVDHGTRDAVKCLQDNCNAKDPPMNGVRAQVVSFLFLPLGVLKYFLLDSVY